MTLLSAASRRDDPRLENQGENPPMSATPLPGIRGLALAGAVMIAVFLAGFGAWAAYAPLASAVQAVGVVAPETRRKTVQHLEGGIIGAILVREGETVAPGQPLVRLDDTRPRAAHQALEGQLWDALAQEARLLAERDGRETITFPKTLQAAATPVMAPVMAQVMAGQQRVFEARRALHRSQADLVRQRTLQTQEEIVGLEALVASLSERIGIVQEEIAAIQPLVDKGLERRPRILALQRVLVEMEGDRGETNARIARARQTIAEAEVSLLTQENDWRNEVAGSLATVQQTIHDLEERMRAAADVLARTEVLAPEAGVVTDLRIHTIGGVVSPGDPLLDLVPQEDHRVVEAQVRPEDIDLVHPGLKAEVRLAPFRQRRAPPIDGEVIYVSADRLIDKATAYPYYAVRIRLDEASVAGAAVETDLVPGMPGEVMIRTGDTTVALYALSPILDSLQRAFREP